MRVACASKSSADQDFVRRRDKIGAELKLGLNSEILEENRCGVPQRAATDQDRELRLSRAITRRSGLKTKTLTLPRAIVEPNRGLGATARHGGSNCCPDLAELKTHTLQRAAAVQKQRHGRYSVRRSARCKNCQPTTFKAAYGRAKG